MTQIRIRQYSFHLSDRFAEGYQLTEGEAQALNSLRAENIRNNMSKTVLAAIGVLAPGHLLGPLMLEELQARIDDYAARYQFIPKHQSRLSKSAVEAEAEAIARERVDTSGRSNLQSEVMIHELAISPEIQALARERVANRILVAAAAMADL